MPGPFPHIAEMLENVAEIINNIFKENPSKKITTKDRATDTNKEEGAWIMPAPIPSPNFFKCVSELMNSLKKIDYEEIENNVSKCRFDNVLSDAIL